MGKRTVCWSKLIPFKRIFWIEPSILKPHQQSSQAIGLCYYHPPISNRFCTPESDCLYRIAFNKNVYVFLQLTSSGHESIGSFPSMHSLAKASPATSLIAETFTTTEQVRTDTAIDSGLQNVTSILSNALLDIN